MKGNRIKETREEQKEFMKGVVQRVLKEFIDAGKLGEKELDDAAKGVLEKMEARVRRWRGRREERLSTVISCFENMSSRPVLPMFTLNYADQRFLTLLLSCT